ncbi:transposase, IS5 family, partial [Nitrosomonas aestuarii]
DTEARWVKKGGQSMFGYKQHTLVDDNGLVSAIISR